VCGGQKHSSFAGGDALQGSGECATDDVDVISRPPAPLLLYGSRWCAPSALDQRDPAEKFLSRGLVSGGRGFSRMGSGALRTAAIPNQRIAVSGQGSIESGAWIQGSGYDVTPSVLSALMPELIADDAPDYRG
jgi:hypothetical protein